ncbi:hypothetical protein EBU24_03245 [bacterium]|nr:hypothetical protein [bacterium]
MDSKNSLPWFRLYREILSDPKVQMLPENFRWRFVGLMCITCDVTATLHDDVICFQLRISKSEWMKTKKAFIANGFIDLENNLLNWDKRQYSSDSSTERSRRFREKKRQCNVAATAPDTDTDTDTEEIKEKIKQKRKIPEGLPSESAVVCVFENWKLSFDIQKAVLDKKRTAVIKKALESYTVEDLQKTFDSYKTSDFHMGRQPGQPKKFIDLTLILRDSEHIEKFWSGDGKPVSKAEQIYRQSKLESKRYFLEEMKKQGKDSGQEFNLTGSTIHRLNDLGVDHTNVAHLDLKRLESN